MTILKRLTVIAAGAAMLCVSFSASADEQYVLISEDNPNVDYRFIYQKDMHFRVDKNDKTKLEIVDHKSDLNYAIFTASVGNQLLFIVHFEKFPDYKTTRKGTTTTGYSIGYRPVQNARDCSELRKDHLTGRVHPVWSHITAKWMSEDTFTLGFHSCENALDKASTEYLAGRIK